MLFLMRRSSSILAIAGGILFLVLPVAFVNGMVSIDYPPLTWRCSPGSLCPLIPYRPPPAGMVPFWTALGGISILLGVLTITPNLNRRSGVSLGLSFSLGSMALLYGVVTLVIQNTFITTPASFLLFPELSIPVMAGTTVLFVYQLLQARLSLPSTVSEASANEIRSE